MTNEEAIKAIKANYPSGGYEDLRKALDMAIKALQEQKVGKWIWGGDSCECSLCHIDPLYYTEPLGLDGGSTLDKPMPFCPNCGAKMEGAE